MGSTALQAFLRRTAFQITGYILAVPIASSLAIAKLLRLIRGKPAPPLAWAWNEGVSEDPIPGLHHSWLTVNGIKLHTVRAGPPTAAPPRPVMLFLHGFPEAWFSWSAQLQEFKQDYDVVAFDMRGYNESDKPAGVDAYRMSQLVSDLEQVILALSPERKIVLVAHDWGGLVAWAFARARPQFLSHLVILCAPHPSNYLSKMDFAQAKRSWYVFFFQTPWLPEAVLADNDFSFVNIMLRGAKMGLRKEGKMDAKEVGRYKQALSRPGVLTSIINYYRALYRFDPDFPRPQKGKLKVPTLLLWAENDGALGPKLFSGTERYVEDITITSLPNCSHWAQQDRPELVNEHIKEFLAHHAATLGSRL